MSARRPGAKLSVLLHGEAVGTLLRRGPSRYRFTYSRRTLAVNRGDSLTLSASLPLRGEPFSPSQAAPFFEGLLPEGSVRTAVARKFGLSEEDGFGMLEELGADCAGAVVILPDVDHPPPAEEEEARPLSDTELEALVAELPRRPLGISPEPGGVRLSLGGVQSKLVLIRTLEGRFALPRGAPSNCLLKPDYGQYEDLATNEAFCMRVASSSGLDTAATELLKVGSTPCLYVERFDRTKDRQWRTVRIHQEDMCQALGILPAAKYEESGGPSVASIVALLKRLGSPRAAVDINAFAKSVLVSFLLGNSDAHGKNYALLYDSLAGVRLAPLYDVVSTTVYEDVTDRLAMKIGGVDDPGEVDLAAWGRLAVESGLGRQLAGFVQEWSTEIVSIAEDQRRIAEAEGWHRPVIDTIVDVCRERAARLIEGR